MADQTARSAAAPGSTDLTRLYAEIARRSGELVTAYLERGRNGDSLRAEDELGIAQAFFEAWTKVLADPMKLAQAQLQLWQDYLALWQNSMLRLMGQPASPAIEPARGDRRFKHEDWQQNFLFDYLKQSYLIASKHLHGVLGNVEGLIPRARSISTPASTSTLWHPPISR
jgi:polyhydroxyalkanoate synthase